MSKKKAFSGSTMTLKDFHGGSIPSNIPLPSAPGVIVRPTDRSGYDRQSSWGNSIGRSDHRLRPNSAGSVRNFDDKTPFLTNSVHIGRNFDEDERKPLDGLSGSRRTVSDDSIRGPLVRAEPKQEGGRYLGQQGLGSSVSQISGVAAGSYIGRVVEGGHTGLNSRTLGGGSGGSYPNAWTARREAVSVPEIPPASWGGQKNAANKLAQASALDKVSSGRWQTKPVHQQTDIEDIRHSEIQTNLYPKESDLSNGMNLVSEKEYHDTKLASHAERGLTHEDGDRNGVREMPGADRVRSPVSDAKEKISYSNGSLPVNPSDKYGNPELQPPTGTVERPKLKLLPRTKPLDASEPSGHDRKQSPLQPSDVGHVETGVAVHSNMAHTKPGLSGNDDAVNRLVERPRLNLKPRSQPLEQSEEAAEKERKSLFGGARPRELVLKERGVDDVVVHNDDMVQTLSRAKNDVPRAETLPINANSPRYGDRVENVHLDHKIGRGGGEKKERLDGDRSDMQKKNWRNENWRNNRDGEKNQQRQQDRQPSPDTWRKPAIEEQPKSDASGLRYGKVVSAVELAQAFSRSVSSEPRPGDQQQPGQLRGGGGAGGRPQVPFSRLTAPAAASRPQINGY